jgi:hypothetical protein
MFWRNLKTESFQTDQSDDDVVAVDEWLAARCEQEDFRWIDLMLVKRMWDVTRAPGESRITPGIRHATESDVLQGNVSLPMQRCDEMENTHLSTWSPEIK